MLICMPAVKHPDMTREVIESVINMPVDLVFGQNGADKSVCDLFHEYKARFPDRIKIIYEPINIGVNPIWNKFLVYFLTCTEYTHIGLLSSDVIVQKDLITVLEKVYLDPLAIPIATTVPKKEVYENLNDTELVLTEIPGGEAGIFIILNREQAKIVTPIPDCIKLWFGDNWIYNICRGVGYKTYVVNNFKVYHYISATLSAMSTTTDLIELDKKYWEETVKKLMIERIEYINRLKS